jgi:ATP-binding cassette, subfamily B, bacterial MsbA
MNDFRRLLVFVKPHSFKLAASLILLAVAGLAEVLTTSLAIPLFDEVLMPVPASGEKFRFLREALSLISPDVVTRVAVALLFFTVIKGVSLYYSNYWMSFVGQVVVTDLRNRLYGHVVRQSMGFFSLNSTGRLMSRMSADVEQVQEAVSNSLSELFRESVLLLALVAWVFWIDWKLAALAFAIAPAALGCTLFMGRRVRRITARARENTATLNDQLQQSITGIRIIKAFGAEQREEDKYRDSSGVLMHANMRAVRILLLSSPVMELLGVIFFIPLLYYAHFHIAQVSLTLGAFSTSLFALFRMYDPIRKLSRLHVQFQRAFASTTRIMEVLETRVAIEDVPDANALSGVGSSVALKDVSFAYNDGTGDGPVLENINLTVSRNEVLAIVGSSGSGKSTLVSLIPRFFDPTSGRVQIDGVDIRSYTQKSLRQNIAMVTQDTFLFNDTVRSNIAYAAPDASDAAVVAAAKAALAHDFIDQLPMKYETLIGERGQRLSGGERQRISIARAILKNATILILDEATSALDSESEKLVQQALANLMQDRTTFVIAHRLSTIRKADRIAVLEQGKIVETGTHESLLALEGVYAHFFRLQHEGAAAPPHVQQAT